MATTGPDGTATITFSPALAQDAIPVVHFAEQDYGIKARLYAQPTNASFVIEANDMTSGLGMPVSGVTIYYTVLDTGLGGTMFVAIG